MRKQGEKEESCLKKLLNEKKRNRTGRNVLMKREVDGREDGKR
jgi:hypothetical protein